MNVSAPILDIVPGPRGLVLSALVRIAGHCTGRTLAANAGVPTASTARILADLVEAGIVEATPAGRATLYCLNRDHLTARGLTELAGLRLALVEKIRDKINDWQPAAVAGWMFGSTSRGDGDRQSDIDLFFVSATELTHTAREQWEQQIGHLANQVENMTGNPVQIVEHTAASFRSLQASGSVLVEELRVDGIELINGSWAAVGKETS